MALAQHWPHWRGPSRDGVSTETGLPVSWGAECTSTAHGAGGPAVPEPTEAPAPAPQGRGGGRGEGRPMTSLACKDFQTKNVAWKLPMPAYSGSTPIIWGNTIFLNVATATNSGVLELWAVDKIKGSVVWKRPLVPSNNMQRKQNMSSPSPVTDGRHVWVMTGFGVFKAFDFAGKEIWSRDLQADYGNFGLNHGYASSPLLRDDGLYVQVLHGMKTDDPSYVLKIDRMTGKTIWRVTAGPPVTSRRIHTHAGMDRSERPRRVDRYGWTTSRSRSRDRQGVLACRRAQPAARRRVSHHRVADDCRRSDHRPDAQQPVVAMRPGGSGDVAATHVAWTFAQGPDVPTPVSDGKLL